MQIDALHTDVAAPAKLRAHKALRTVTGYTAHVCHDNGIPSHVAHQICAKRIGRQGSQQAVTAVKTLMNFDTDTLADEGHPFVQGVNIQYHVLQKKEVFKTQGVKRALRAYQQSGQLILPSYEVTEIINGVYDHKLAYRKFHPDYLVYPDLKKTHVGGKTGGL